MENKPSPVSALPAPAAGGLPPPPTSANPSPALAKDPSYKAIKTRYFQSLNLGKQRSPRSSADGTSAPVPPRKPVPTATSAPIATHTHVRRRSNTQPGVFFAPLPPKEERKQPSNAPDNYMQFAMSVPAHMVLAQSYAPSYMPSSSLDARLPRDNSFDDFDDEPVYGRGRATSFESSQPIQITGNSREDNSPILAASNFVDRETDDAEAAQRRRAAKIRSMVSAEAD